MALVAFIIFLKPSEPHTQGERKEESEDRGWEYGDEWKKGTPDDKVSEEDVSYVEILRGDTGKGYDESYMAELIGYLGSKGIKATFDSFSVGLEGAAFKTYSLLVERGKEDEAKKYIKEKEG